MIVKGQSSGNERLVAGIKWLMSDVASRCINFLIVGRLPTVIAMALPGLWVDVNK